MKRINMTKYGFIRFEEGDFSDDGNRFTCYTLSPNSRLRISKLVSEGRVYLSSHMNGNRLDHTEYSKLPHYQDATWNYNGEDVDDLVEQDLVNFYNACVEYEKEYLEAESKTVFPTLEEIKAQCEKINQVRQDEIDEVTTLLQVVAPNLFLKGASDYELRNLRNEYQSLLKRKYDVNNYSKSICETAYSKSFVKSTNSYLQPSYEFRDLMRTLNSYK